jgi:hypothetical protein
MATPNHGVGTNGLLSNRLDLADKPGEGVHTDMKTLAVLVFLAATPAGTSVAQMFTPACPMLKPITDLPPLGHPNATQQCVCESTNRCHWAWVDQPTIIVVPNTTTDQTINPPPYVNQSGQAFGQALQRFIAERREKKLRQQQQFIEQQQHEAEQQQRELEAGQDAQTKAQNDQANDLEILKAVHEGILVLVTPEDPAICNLQGTATQRDQCRAKLAAQFAAYGPTIKNSSGQVFRVVAPASDPATPTTKPIDSDQYFTQGLLNGRMWAEMSEPDRAFYVAAFLQGYAISCLYSNDDAAAQKTCYAKLGDPVHTNPVDPHEIVNGVDGIFAVPENRGLIIPVAIRAASMKASGEPQASVDDYLLTERNAEGPTGAKP